MNDRDVERLARRCGLLNDTLLIAGVAGGFGIGGWLGFGFFAACTFVVLAA